ncbi:3-oxoacyl-[acyl-carrier-protein] synthase III C-terminal domain-containing protein [Streptomyces fuscichromogenes]|uniref:3-oxoacyl-[acyl-carrier-protein] synthase III C-terminal domain-containing protein n=1 Tax=Streptomyces fuscichromogenes TaxID=1324013 RepID=UPI00381CF6D0
MSTAALPLFHISGTGRALPGDAVSNAELGRAFGISESWIDVFVGTRTRYFGRDLASGKVTHTLTDLCAEAADRALAAAGTAPADVDFLVLATATPDALLPTTANETADRLGLTLLPTYQLQAGCAGAVQALDLARALLAGGHRTGLVVAGDVTDRFLDTGPDVSRLPAQELVNYVLFGDGAAAAVVTADPGPDHAALAVHALLHHFAGLGRPPGQIVGWHGAAAPDPARQMLFEDYRAIEAQVPALAAQTVTELLAATGWAPEQIGHVLPPQLSGRMTDRIMAGLPLPAGREVSCVRETGNTGNALPLLQLDLLAERLEPGGRALAAVVESSKWIKAGLALERPATGRTEDRP